jgi:glycosyltransferase involved in cell wall biosynthesis
VNRTQTRPGPEIDASQSPARTPSQKRVQVLLATYNGASFLPAQLASLAAQDFPAIDIVASDDGSSDHTQQQLESFAAGWEKGTFALKDGPRAGFAENFRHLILSADDRADYTAFCDQDDLWDPDKLSIGISALDDLPVDVPALYCSRTRAFRGNRAIGFSPDFRRPPSFRNALVQSIAGGNTMVVNQAALHLLKKSTANARFVSHDWWAYLIVSGAGGRVVFDRQPHIDYRQHDRNLVGRNNSVVARFRRLLALLDGQFSRWSTTHLEALASSASLLSAENRDIVQKFAAARNGPMLDRFRSLRRSGVYRMTVLAQITLYLACLLKKI